MQRVLCRSSTGTRRSHRPELGDPRCIEGRRSQLVTLVRRKTSPLARLAHRPSSRCSASLGAPTTNAAYGGLRSVMSRSASTAPTASRAAGQSLGSGRPNPRPIDHVDRPPSRPSSARSHHVAMRNDRASETPSASPQSREPAIHPARRRHGPPADGPTRGPSPPRQLFRRAISDCHPAWHVRRDDRVAAVLRKRRRRPTVWRPPPQRPFVAPAARAAANRRPQAMGVQRRPGKSRFPIRVS